MRSDTASLRTFDMSGVRVVVVRVEGPPIFTWPIPSDKFHASLEKVSGAVRVYSCWGIKMDEEGYHNVHGRGVVLLESSACSENVLSAAQSSVASWHEDGSGWEFPPFKCELSKPVDHLFLQSPAYAFGVAVATSMEEIIGLELEFSSGKLKAMEPNKVTKDGVEDRQPLGVHDWNKPSRSSVARLRGAVNLVNSLGVCCQAENRAGAALPPPPCPGVAEERACANALGIAWTA